MNNSNILTTNIGAVISGETYYATTTNPMASHYDADYLTIAKYMASQKEYENYIWKFKEENEMIESLEIVRLYKNNREASITDKYNKKFEELKSNNKLAKEFEELVNSFKASVQQLYTSQFEEGQMESTVVSNTLALINNGNTSIMPVRINESFYPEGANELEDKKKQELFTLSELCAKVTAVLKICKTKSEIEEELVKYGIYNKKKELDLVDLSK